MSDLLFSGVTAVPMDGPDEVLKDAYVGVTGGKITYVGRTPPQEPSARVIDGKRKVLMPGLCNGHTHIAMTLLRGYADDYDLQTWLHEHIFPAEAKMTDDMVYWGAKLATLEMMAGGTVSFTDMYDHMDAVARAADESGMKANLTRALMDFSDSYDFEGDFRVAEMRELGERWHGHDGGRLLVDVAIHGEYTSRRDLWEAASGYAKEHGLGMNVHLSETRFEHEECKRKYGRTPAQVLAAAGVFDVRAVAAHCVWLENDDIEIMREKGVTAVHNPVSNLKLASGAANVPLMLERGLNVALGTDGVASNNSHDMFEEIKAAALLHKYVRHDPQAINAAAALRLAVTGGFVSQGRGGESGKIAEGCDADLILLDFDKPHLTPCHNVVSNLVYAARGSDVCMALVRGKILYENGRYLTVDAERVLFEVAKAASVYRV